MSISIDASPCSAVAICTICGWRDVAPSRRTARLFALQHTDTAHGYDQRGHDALYRATRRAAAVR